MPPDFRTITLETAIRAVRAYNSGTYRGIKNTIIDQRGRELFAGSLGQTYQDILQQVRFIGDDYGGVAGFPSAIQLAPKIAAAIFENRSVFIDAVQRGTPLLKTPSPKTVIEILYTPFVQPLGNKRNWQVWGAKFWHFLNPEAFPLEDSRVDRFFDLYNQSHSMGKYLELMRRFQQFALGRQSWVPDLRAADESRAWSDLKLWDKVCYGVRDLKEVRKESVSEGKIAGRVAGWNAASNREREGETRRIVRPLRGEDEVRALVKSSFPHIEALYSYLRSKIAERMPYLRAERETGGEGWIKFRNLRPGREAKRQYCHFHLVLEKRRLRIQIWFDDNRFAPAKEAVETKELESAMYRKSGKGFYITKEDQIDGDLMRWLERAA